MNISSHFNLGFRDTSSKARRSTEVRAKRKVSPAISVLVLVFCLFLILPLFVYHSPQDNHPAPSGALTAAPAIVALLVLGLVLGAFSFFLHLLRRLANPLYWQIACWFLVTVGILLRPFVVSGADPLQTSVKGAVTAGIVSLGIFPGLMRLLNRLKPEPGLMHVALPFGLGFFLDVAQVVAKTYVPGLAWLR